MPVVGDGAAFKYFYLYELTGELDQSGMDYLAEMDIHDLPEVRDAVRHGLGQRAPDPER